MTAVWLAPNENDNRSIAPLIVIGVDAASSIVRKALTAACADIDATDKPAAATSAEILIFIETPFNLLPEEKRTALFVSPR
jgi:hypothetical protein